MPNRPSRLCVRIRQQHCCVGNAGQKQTSLTYALAFLSAYRAFISSDERFFAAAPM